MFTSSMCTVWYTLYFIYFCYWDRKFTHAYSSSVHTCISLIITAVAHEVLHFSSSPTLCNPYSNLFGIMRPIWNPVPVQLLDCWTVSPFNHLILFTHPCAQKFSIRCIYTTVNMTVAMLCLLSSLLYHGMLTWSLMFSMVPRMNSCLAMTLTALSSPVLGLTPTWNWTYHTIEVKHCIQKQNMNSLHLHAAGLCGGQPDW